MNQVWEYPNIRSKPPHTGVYIDGDRERNHMKPMQINQLHITALPVNTVYQIHT